MNPKYYTTREELERVKSFINKHGIHGGVESETLPNFLGPFKIPDVKDKAMYGILLRSGTEMNAGLCLDLIEKYPEFAVVQLLNSMRG